MVPGQGNYSEKSIAIPLGYIFTTTVSDTFQSHISKRDIITGIELRQREFTKLI